MNIKDELKKYYKKKEIHGFVKYDSLELENHKDIEDISKSIKRLVVQNKSFYETTEKNLKAEIEEQKEKIDELEIRNKALEQKQDEMARGIVLIMDEIDRLKDYAIESKNKKLQESINRNIMSINRILSKISINKIESIGKIFNADYHNCIEIRRDTTRKNYEIVDEVRTGYTFKDKVLRASQVVVNKNERKIR